MKNQKKINIKGFKGSFKVIVLPKKNELSKIEDEELYILFENVKCEIESREFKNNYRGLK